MNPNTTCLIIFIIFISGLLGGISNYLKSDRKSLFRNLIISIIAASITPLFLSLVSSSILENIYRPEKDDVREINLFIFLGYSLICSFSADNFMNMISVRVINQQLKKEKEEAEYEKNIAQTNEILAKQEAKGILNSIDPEKKRLDELKAKAMSAKKNTIPEINDSIDNNNDPEKGKWGGKPVSNGRQLLATVTDSLLVTSFFNIHLTVCSLDKNKPLEGEVVFYLHPTFHNPVRKIKVKEGKAQLDLLSYGSFTVGVSCDDGNTLLELDLAELPKVSKRFKEN